MILYPVVWNSTGGGGGGGVSDSFTTVQTDVGTYPTASGADTLILTTDNQSFAEFDGDATTDTISLNFLYTPEDQANKSTDGTLADNSSTLYPSQSAVKTYADAKVSDTAYDATSWNSVTTIAPSKNAVRDQIETMLTSIAAKATFLGVQTLTDGANISWNLANGHGSVTLAGNRTLDNPTNQTAGQWYILKVAQDSTGGRTLSWGSTYKWTDGIYPVLSAGANAADVFYFWSDGTNMYGTTIGFNFS